jgi:hypothetical protein
MAPPTLPTTKRQRIITKGGQTVASKITKNKSSIKSTRKPIVIARNKIRRRYIKPNCHRVPIFLSSKPAQMFEFAKRGKHGTEKLWAIHFVLPAQL